MIRTALTGDIPRILRMVRAYHRDVRNDADICEAQVCGELAALIQRDSGCVLLAGDDSAGGAVVAVAGSGLWSSSQVAEVQFLWVDPALRGGAMAPRLLDAFEDWASGQGAVRFAVSFTGKSLEPLLARRGYCHAQTTMMRGAA